MAWGDKQKWWNNEKSERRPKNQRKASESKDSNNGGKGGLPSYDRVGGGASSSSATSTTGIPSQEQLYQALLACAAKDRSVATLVETLVPPTLAEDQEIRNQQQSLNKLRKCRQKIAKKEALVKTENDQWALFVEEMRQHVSSEKARHHAEIQSLEEEITELKNELALLKSGQEKPEEDEKMDLTLDELLAAEQDEKKNLQAQLDQAKLDMQEAHNVAYAMQAQMQAFLEYQQLAAGGAPTVEHPAASMAPPNTPQRPKLPMKRDPKAPFGVAARDPFGVVARERTPRGSRYGTKPTVVNVENAGMGLPEGMD